MATARFLIDLRIGSRAPEMALALVASVASCCRALPPLTILVDDHRPYPQAILRIFGVRGHRRRGQARGRRKHADLKPSPGLLAGIVSKLRDASGDLVRVKRKRLFGRLKDVPRGIEQLGLGQDINTAHGERLNCTIRTQQRKTGKTC